MSADPGQLRSKRLADSVQPAVRQAGRCDDSEVTADGATAARPLSQEDLGVVTNLLSMIWRTDGSGNR